MIELRDVSKVYETSHGQVRALDQLSVKIDAHEFVAVRGPSGCGKSTLLAVVGGLALPTSGTVMVDHLSVSAMSSAERARFRETQIGFVFQMFHLLPYLSVLDNVVLAASQGNGNDRLRAEELLHQFGLRERRWHRPGQLSAGERQRVAMARALLNSPRLILADEPTGNLDPKNASIVLDLLSEYHDSGGTILLVTHDAEAARRAPRQIELQEGKLLSDARR